MDNWDLQQWLGYIESIHVRTIDMGLTRVKQVAERMQMLRPAGWVVTVAGTNGKGSSCCFLETLALSYGLRVGRYSSPHLLSFNERICVQGQPVADASLIQAFQAIEQARAEISLSYFEFTTLAGLWIFSQQALDVAILEVGLGGRLDAVNLVDADAALVVSIALDHQDYLGSDLNGIAVEKLGIARPASPLVINDGQPLPALQQAGSLTQAPVLRVNQDFGIDGGDFYWPGLQGQARWPLFATALPQENLAAVLALWSLSPWGLTMTEARQRLLSQASMPGRMQSLPIANGRLFLDVAHNPHAAQRLAHQLRSFAGHWTLIFSALVDKDIEGIVTAFADLSVDWVLVPLSADRGLSAQQLATRCQLPAAATFQSVAQALTELTPVREQIVVFGSFVTVTEALQWHAAQ